MLMNILNTEVKVINHWYFSCRKVFMQFSSCTMSLLGRSQNQTTSKMFKFGCGSGVEPASCYQRVAGLIPWSASVLGQDTEPQTVSDVLVGTLAAICVWMYVWITVSCFGKKHLLNTLNVKLINYLCLLLSNSMDDITAQQWDCVLMNFSYFIFCC